MPWGEEKSNLHAAGLQSLRRKTQPDVLKFFLELIQRGVYAANERHISCLVLLDCVGAIMKIEVYGSGCHSCKELERRATEAVTLAGVSATVEHVYDMEKIIAKGVFITPALVVDGKTVASGKIPTVSIITEMLKKAA